MARRRPARGRALRPRRRRRPGFKYGVRVPGESATYAAAEPPDSSLSAIADSLDE
ncbi:hypothetical protein [Halobacterium sp. CBA1126]|uniref:DUF7112 family protein n=1 Tax=Halobacterium sp. CBA1126 TaxID=2668074 RepID=UPI001E2BAB77|nr:hypothetical protein [Halobacterium sp. CBA1126]